MKSLGKRNSKIPSKIKVKAVKDDDDGVVEVTLKNNWTIYNHRNKKI